MTDAELRALPAAVDIETAARALGIGRSKAYSLARRNELGVRVLRFGRAYRVVTAELLHLLGIVPERTDENHAA